MGKKDSKVDPCEVGSPEVGNVIDLRPYLRGEPDEYDVPLDAAPPRDVDERRTDKGNVIDHQVRSMFLDAVDLPIPGQLAALVNQLGSEADADEDPSGIGDHG